MNKKSLSKSWIVRLKSVVIQEIVCEGCTEAEARELPWSHHDGCEPTEIETDSEVVSVHESK